MKHQVCFVAQSWLTVLCILWVPRNDAFVPHRSMTSPLKGRIASASGSKNFEGSPSGWSSPLSTTVLSSLEDKEKLLEELSSLTLSFEQVQQSVNESKETYQKGIQKNKSKIENLERENTKLKQECSHVQASLKKNKEELKNVREKLSLSVKKINDERRDNAEHWRKARRHLQQENSKNKQKWETSTYNLEMEKKLLERQLNEKESQLTTIQDRLAQVQSTQQSLADEWQKMQGEEQQKMKQTIVDLQQQLTTYETDRNSIRKLVPLIFSRLAFKLRLRRRKKQGQQEVKETEKAQVSNN